MQHVSTYNSHLQATLRTVIALQSCCAHLGFNIKISDFTIAEKRSATVPQTESRNVQKYKWTETPPPLPPDSNGEFQKQKNNGHKQFRTRQTLNPNYNSTVNISHFVCKNTAAKSL